MYLRDYYIKYFTPSKSLLMISGTRLEQLKTEIIWLVGINPERRAKLSGETLYLSGF